MKWQGKPVDRPFVFVSAILSLSIIVGALVYGHERKVSVDKMISDSETVTVSIIQGNIDQDVKWDMAFRNATIDTYFRLSQQEMALQNPALIIWPESRPRLFRV